METNELNANVVNEVVFGPQNITKEDRRLLVQAEDEAFMWADGIHGYNKKPNTRKSGWYMTYINIAFEQLVGMRQGGQGVKLGTEEQVHANVIKWIKALNKSRHEYGREVLSVKYFTKWYNDVERRFLEQEIREYRQVTSLIEAGLPDGVDEIDWSEVANAEATADMAMYQSDPQWSAKALKAIVELMDPDGLGYATKPMKFNGTYEDRRGNKYPLKHLSVIQSLMWLSGSRAKGTRGFLSDVRFTKEDREVLIDFVRASWDVVKGK
jgi:hypothetical protein